MILSRLIVLLVLLAPLNSISQTAIDFTMKDLNGVEWNLYSELNKGKTVMLDFFFADCVPCQTLTPQIVSMYNDYGGDTGNVVIFGISDRDDNQKLLLFEQTYGVNYHSVGTDGGGDTITSLYMNWFSFLAWPTYAVVCPNKSIDWNIKKNSGMDSVSASLDFCISITDIEKFNSQQYSSVIFPNPVNDVLNLKSNQLSSHMFTIFDSTGRNIKSGSLHDTNASYSISTQDIGPGIYFLKIETFEGPEILKIIKSL